MQGSLQSLLGEPGSMHPLSFSCELYFASTPILHDTMRLGTE